MAKKKKHARGALLGKFCTVAVYNKKCKCPTPNNYRDNTTQPWGNPFQAHHLVPITSVESVITSDADLKGTVEQTQWCINKAPNMYAMPVWGHTVKHYCRITKAFHIIPPGFVNIPQHSNDHHLYNKEVSGMLGVAKDDWEPHDVTASTIAGMLDGVGSTMKGQLVTRGSTRTGGTHVAWMAALAASEKGEELAEWYKPFSMAAQPTERAFPIKGESSGVRAFINAIQQAMSAF